MTNTEAKNQKVVEVYGYLANRSTL
jgi:hypothetical protein